ncbi:hypothetical protein ABW21_db0202788 [Orbilia brochopaga]|nr:hypothetical protein ABW21_db0202788 [Drechslerella brochopaga]
MGCAASKQELGRRLKTGRKNDIQIGSPTDFQHSHLSYPSTLCIECDLPSRALLDSLGNTDTSLCCSCGDSSSETTDVDLSAIGLGFELDLNLKPLSPITLSPLYTSSPPPSSPLSLISPFKPQELEVEDEEHDEEIIRIGHPVQSPTLRRELPTHYNFEFNFLHRSNDDCVCLDPYVVDGHDEEEDEEPIQPTHKRCESFTSNAWKVDHKVVVTAKEVPPCPGSSSQTNSRSNSRSNSFASLRNGLRSAAALLSRHPDPEPFIEDDNEAAPAPTVSQGTYVSRSRIWGGKTRLSFDMLNRSSPDLLSASARKSQRVSKDEVKVVRIRSTRSTNWLSRSE